MIFITLGTQKFQLNRLLKKIDKMIQNGLIEETIFAQIGYSDYHPQNYKFTEFLNREEFKKVMERSSLVITHGGVGSIITALNANKPVIVFPRLSEYKEHVDNHQLEIAKAFCKKNFVLCCNNEEELESMIDRAYNHNFDKYISSTRKIVETVKNFLE